METANKILILCLIFCFITSSICHENKLKFKSKSLKYDFLECYFCTLFVDYLGDAVASNTSVEDAIDISFPVCAYIWQVEDAHVVRKDCPRYIKIY